MQYKTFKPRIRISNSKDINNYPYYIEHHGVHVQSDVPIGYYGYDLGNSINGIYVDIKYEDDTVVINKSVYGNVGISDGAIGFNLNYEMISPYVIEMVYDRNGLVETIEYQKNKGDIDHYDAFNDIKEILTNNTIYLVNEYDIDTIYNSIGVNSACIQTIHDFKNRFTDTGIIRDGIVGTFGDNFTYCTPKDLYLGLMEYGDSAYNNEAIYYHEPSLIGGLSDTYLGYEVNGYKTYSPWADVRYMISLDSIDKYDLFKNTVTNRYKKALLLRSNYIYYQSVYNNKKTYELGSGYIFKDYRLNNNKYELVE